MMSSWVAIAVLLFGLAANGQDLESRIRAHLVAEPARPAERVAPTKDKGWVLRYNVWRTSPNWTYPGSWTGQRRQYILGHLMTATAHRGKFTRAKLETLTIAQLERLHSNDHEAKPYAWTRTGKATSGKDGWELVRTVT